jgi:hypothetical protein
MLKRNPYYNKSLLLTRHGVNLDGDSLFKMGQITQDERDSKMEEKM